MRVDGFYSLTPDVILEATERVGSRATGQFLQLNSYENRVVEVWLEDGRRVVSKFYRPRRWKKETILQEHEFMADLVASEVPTVLALPLDGGSQTLAEHDGLLFSVFEKAIGRPTHELDDSQVAWLGRLTGRLHQVGAQKTAIHRPIWNVNSLGIESFQTLLESGLLPKQFHVPFKSVVPAWLDSLSEMWGRINPKMQRIHGDLHVSNLLWGESGPFFLDFDDFGMGPRIQDFWLLMPGARDSAEGQNFLSVFARNYEMFAEFPDGELGLIEELRKLRMLKHASWLALRWEDPTFPKAFPWFGTENYFSTLLSDLREF